MLERMRWRLTMGYAGIFALILLLLATAAVVGFSRELTNQQDTLLTQEAKDVERNLLDGDHREVLAEGSAEYSWVALDTEDHVTDRDPSAATLGTLGLPSKELARQTLEEDEGVSATIHGPQGRVRVVSMPMSEESGEVVGVIQYGRSLEGVQQTIGRLVLVLLPLALGGLGAALFGGLYMAGRAMRPARESFEKQRAFVADASHELKTPLTLIRADAEMVLYREHLNQEDRKLVEHALAETERMGVIYSWSPDSTPAKPNWPQSPLISSRFFQRKQSASGCGRLLKRSGSRPGSQANSRFAGTPRERDRYSPFF
jgi:signal transduction histidine kinase